MCSAQLAPESQRQYKLAGTRSVLSLMKLPPEGRMKGFVLLDTIVPMVLRYHVHQELMDLREDSTLIVAPDCAPKDFTAH